MLSLPSIIFDFDWSPSGTSLNFSALFVVAVVAMVMVVVVLMLGLFFWLTVEFRLSPPSPFTFFPVKGEGA